MDQQQLKLHIPQQAPTGIKDSATRLEVASFIGQYTHLITPTTQAKPYTSPYAQLVPIPTSSTMIAKKEKKGPIEATFAAPQSALNLLHQSPEAEARPSKFNLHHPLLSLPLKPQRSRPGHTLQRSLLDEDLDAGLEVPQGTGQLRQKRLGLHPEELSSVLNILRYPKGMRSNL